MKLMYSAFIEYSPENLRRLNKIINSTFKLGIKAIYISICLAFFVAGAYFGLQDSKGVMLVCIGCFLLPSMRALENSRVNNAIKQLNGNIIKVNYSFYDDCFVCSNEKENNKFSYDSIIRLVEQNEYLYMFPNKYQAYMIKISSLAPSERENRKSFKDFISFKTGLEWTKPVSLLNINLKRIRFNLKNTKKQAL